MPSVGFQMLNVLSDILHQATKSFCVRVFLVVKQVPATGQIVKTLKPRRDYLLFSPNSTITKSFLQCISAAGSG